MMYDIVVFHSNEDVDQFLKWFDRLYNTITDQISVIEAALNSLLAESDRDPEISKLILNNNNRSSVSDETNPSGAIPGLLILSGFYTENVSSVPNHRDLLESLMTQRVRMLEVIYGARKKIRDLRNSIMFGEQPVILIWEALWYVLGQKYLFSPVDAQEYFCLKGECSTQAFPLVYYDPYFAFIEGGGASGFGGVGSSVDAL